MVGSNPGSGSMVRRADFTQQCNSRAKGACLVKIRCHFALFVSVLQHFHRYDHGQRPAGSGFDQPSKGTARWRGWPRGESKPRRQINAGEFISDHDTVTCQPPFLNLSRQRMMRSRIRSRPSRRALTRFKIERDERSIPLAIGHLESSGRRFVALGKPLVTRRRCQSEPNPIGHRRQSQVTIKLFIF